MVQGQYRYMLLGPWYKGSTGICYWGHGTRAVQVYVTRTMAQGQYRYMLLGHGTRAVQVYVTGLWHQGSTGTCYWSIAPGPYRYILLGYGTRAVQIYVTGGHGTCSVQIYVHAGQWHKGSPDLCNRGMRLGQTRSILLGAMVLGKA